MDRLRLDVLDRPFSIGTIAAINAHDGDAAVITNESSTFHTEPGNTFIGWGFFRRSAVFLLTSPSPSFICFPFLLRARATLTGI